MTEQRHPTEQLSPDLSYREKQGRLADRIRAHKLFANLDIADWIRDFLARRKRSRIFDLGCGDGNHLGLYLESVGPSGSVSGLDREPSLIAACRERYPEARNLDLRVGSMDDRLPYSDNAFDLSFSNFAIYNARNLRATLGELNRCTERGGEVVLIGPTGGNARELYEYNKRLTGVAIDPVTEVRADRLLREVAPVARDIFAELREERVYSELTFPSADEFVRYFRATMLYETGAEKSGYTVEQLLAACGPAPIVVSKEMVAVISSVS
jgi:ubiquinone/menaquinone biosynthesis C-methylase UbiE